MANQEHLDILKQGVEAWNKWREKNSDVQADLSNIDFHRDSHIYSFQHINLSRANLTKAIIGGDFKDANFSNAILRAAEFSVAYLDNADLSNSDLRNSIFEGTTFEGINLSGADLRNATIMESSISGDVINYVNLSEVNLSGANLSKMDLQAFDLSGANLSRANLKGADLRWANLSEANLHAAKLNGATLSWANLSKADLSRANLTGCRIYGISAWDVHLEDAIQKDLIITSLEETLLPNTILYPNPNLYPGKSEITVDNLEVAQFINLLLNNQKVRDIIDTITSKVVLILGRFTDERKPVLDALRNELRNYNCSPIVFDFESSVNRDLTETVSILAHMSRFIIADLTDAKSIPQELERIVPHLPSVPVQPILHKEAKEYSMFEHYEHYPWVLPIYRYQDIPCLLASIKEHIIKPIEQKEFEKGRMRELEEENTKLKKEIKKLRELSNRVQPR